MRYPTTFILIVAGLAGFGAASAGDIFCNNQGRDCSDRWSPGATVVRTSAPPQSARAAAVPSTSAAMPTDAGANARLGLDASRTAVQKDVSAARAEQCKLAKEKYGKSVVARRVYRMNSAGEREYLTDAEADQARLNARLEMERSCGNPAS